MGAVDDFGPELDTDLPLIGDTFPLAAVQIEDDVPLLSIDDNTGGLFPDHEPLLQISFATVQMCLIFGPQSVIFEFLPDLST